ncbi:hypothetical protein INT45_000063 [Circinella minor]|uniref:Retrotransposon gag domain-containing protein n=1 Tax=Circinella minor TaxID=1195481 RepID=A0A8H7RTK8_9FUNG|nr:hypothetical protein INT45_000063 [Circinella minor]
MSTFSGTKDDENPMVWLHKVKRLWLRGNFSDEEVLLIAASNLTGQAELWWVPLEETIATWEAFEEAFKLRFISAEHCKAWWSKIEAVKQGENESVEHVAFKLQELFPLVGPITEIFQKEAVNKAVRIENAQKKYLYGQENIQGRGNEVSRNIAIGIPKSTVSTIKPEDSASQNQTLLSQVANSLHALQLQLDSSSHLNNRVLPPNYPPRPPPKWKWQRIPVKGETGVHNNNTPQERNNIVKESSSTGPRQLPKINLVEAAQVNAVEKRRRGASDMSVTNGRTGKRPDNNSFKLPLLNQQPEVPSSSRSQEPVVLPPKNKNTNKRQPPRKLLVELEKPDVWETLKKLDSGLSVVQWLALGKKAYVNVRDGLKYLYERRQYNLSNRVMDVNVLKVDSELKEENSNDGSDDGTDWDSTWSEGSVYSSDRTSDEEDNYNLDDTEYNYPYDLQNMKKSIPLHGPIIINGQVVQAIFDSGASVSVLSQSLVNKLNLVLSGDTLAVSTMDEKSDRACKIVKNIPIRIAGKLRPEHMCIEPSNKWDLCLLGTTWFRAYGITTKVEHSTIIIPTKKGRGYVELQADFPDTSVTKGKSKEVFAVAVDLNEEKKTTKNNNQQENSASLNFYIRVSQASKFLQIFTNRYSQRILKVANQRRNR